MVFGSLYFLAVFLPVAVFGHWALQLALRGGRAATVAANAWLLCASLAACFLWDLKGLPVFAACAVATDVAARIVHRSRRERVRSIVAAAGVTANLALLCFFKYDGIVESWVSSCAPDGIIPAPRIVIPLGMSFWVFRAISYLIDVRRGTHPPAANPLDFICWMALFPIFVSGPIVRWNDVAESFRSRPFSADLAASGFRRLFVGVAKKALVADILAGFANAAWTVAGGGHGMSPGMAFLAVAAYSLQLYFDFSGYSDMAIGIGRLLGFRFKENFLWPYAATGIRDFWRRWHISLSVWFRDYLYIPLGGGRAGTARACLNSLVVFTLCGVWHGVGLPFAAWGLWHGILVCCERLFGPKPQTKGAPLPRRGFATAAARFVLAHAYAIAAVFFGWIFFRSPDFSTAWTVVKSLFGAIPAAREARTLWLDCTPLFSVTLAFAAVFCLPVVPFLRRQLRRIFGETAAWSLESIVATILFLAALLSVAAGTRQSFLYFQF